MATNRRKCSNCLLQKGPRLRPMTVMPDRAVFRGTLLLLLTTVTCWRQTGALADPAAPNNRPPSSSGISARLSKVVESSVRPNVVRAGDNVTFTCKVDHQIAFNSEGCMWIAPGSLAPVLPLRPYQTDSAIVALTDPAKERYNCDFLITAVRPEHHGRWECSPLMDNNDNLRPQDRIPLYLSVAEPPTPPKPVFPGYEDPRGAAMIAEVADDGEERNFTCGLLATRPAPSFSWYIVSTSGIYEEPLDVEPYLWNSTSSANPDLEDLNDYYSNITVSMSGDWNSRRLRCYADHMGLEGFENFTDVTLNVQAGPRDRLCNETHGLLHSVVPNYSCEQGAFNFLRGADAKVSILFSANPAPGSVKWLIPGITMPFDGMASGNGYVAQWGPASAFGEEHDAYWDRGDLFWANLTMFNFRGWMESENYVLELDNGIAVPDDGSNTDYPQRLIDQQLGINNNNGQQNQASVYPGNNGNQNNNQRIVGDFMPPQFQGGSGISPRLTTVRQIKFAVRPLPGGVNSGGLGGGAIAGIVLGVLAIVVIIAVVIVARVQGLLCFKNGYNPRRSAGLNGYFRQSLERWRAPRAANQQRYDGVATAAAATEADGAAGPPPQPRLEEEIGVRGGGLTVVDGGGHGANGSSTTATTYSDDEPPPRPPKPSQRNSQLRDYRDHSQLSEGEDVV